LNIQSTNFHAEMVTLHFGRISYLVGPRGIFVQILTEVFSFFFWIEFCIYFVCPLYMPYTNFRAKTPLLYSDQNS